jgi:hypothetical protein
MDRRNEANQSREGLLRAYNKGESVPLRKSLEDAYRSESDDDLDATEFLQSDPLDDRSKPAVEAYGVQKRLSQLRRSFNKRAKCLLIILAVLIVFWSILAGGGFWLYKKAPMNGRNGVSMEREL